MAKSEQAASREAIAHYLKNVRLKEGHGYDGALNTMISRLRKRWSDTDITTPLPIKTIRGSGYEFAGHDKLVIKDRRDEHFHRVLLHHYAMALSVENGGFSDLDREISKKLLEAIKMSVPLYFIHRATEICDLVVRNAPIGKQDYEHLLQSEEARAQFLMIMTRFMRFLLESPNERLQWLITQLRLNDHETLKPSTEWTGEEVSNASQTLILLSHICHYMNQISRDDAVLTLMKHQLTLTDVEKTVAGILAISAQLNA